MYLAKLENLLLFLTLVLLPTQLGRHFWPDFSFVYSIKVDYLSPTIYFWDLLVLTLISIFIVQRKTVNQLALNLGLIFILSQSISLLPLLFSPNLINIGSGLVRIEQYLITVLFGVYIASQKFEEIARKLFLPFSIAVIFISTLGILQFIFGQSIGFWILGERSFSISTPAIAKFDYHGWQFLRPYSVFSHPNVLAAFILIIIPLLSLNISSLKQKQIFYTALVAASFVTVLTVARTAIVAGVVALGFSLQKRLFLAFVIILLVISPFLYTRFSSIRDYDSLSLARREQMNTIAFNLFKENLVFGVGVNNFIPMASDQLLIGPSRFLQPVHNVYLLTLSETGLLGFLALIFIFTSALFAIYKADLSLETKNRLYITWIIIAFLGLFDHYFLTAPQGYRLLFLVWGLSLSNMERNS